MERNNKMIIEGIEDIQRVCFEYECLKNNDPCIRNIILELESSSRVIDFKFLDFRILEFRI
jgi:hypothetical protein